MARLLDTDVCPVSRPFSSHLWHLKGPPPSSFSHSHPAAHTNRNLRVFMAQCREASRSPQLQPAMSAPKDGMSTPSSHSFAQFSQGVSSRAHSLLRSDFQLWCDPSLLVVLLWGFSPPSLFLFRGLLPRRPPPSLMPRPRGKPKHGAAWYEARGRKPPTSAQPCEASSLPRAVSPLHPDMASPPPLAPMVDHPSEEGFPPPLAPLVVPTPSQPPCDPDTGLSPLSNPYGCRVEWFDLLGNSLGYAPPPPSPPRRPSFPPPPPHPSPATSPPSPLLGSSSSSPLSNHPNSFSGRGEEQAELMTTLSNIKKDLEDIKLAMHETQTREDDRWRRVDTVMAFLQDLRWAMADREKGKAQAAQVYAGPRLGPGF
jgi:hypothetical protein